MKTFFSAESKLALAVIKHIVYGRNNGIESLIKNENINWPEFKKILIYHELLPFAYRALKDFFSLLPRDIVKTLSATYYHYLNYNLFLEQLFLNLHRVFKEKDMPFIPLKGMSLLQDLYAGYPVRMARDMDVLIRKKDIEQAEQILKSSGFKKELGGLKENYWLKKQYHYIFTKGQTDGGLLIIEIHWDIDYPRKKNGFVPGIFDRLRPFQIQDKTIELLSPEDTLFVLALHQRHFGKSLSLKYACDTALLLNKYGQGMDWDYVLNQSEKNKTRASLFFTLYQAKFWLNTAIPEKIWRDLSKKIPRREKIKKFTAKNTFSVNKNSQNLYLKTFFLLYDTIYEPIIYILNIPLEQFAKFYDLKPYTKKTAFLYHFRMLYILFRIMVNSNKIKFATNVSTKNKKTIMAYLISV
jgi:hypothetical protein